MISDETRMIEQIYAGEPIDGFRIIDCHAHMGYYINMHIPAPEPEDMLNSMDRLGIDLCCFSHHMGVSSDFQMGNKLAAEAMCKYPDRFMAYATVNPHYPHKIKDELHRCFYDNGFRLIKFHPFLHRYPITGSGYKYALEFAEQCHAPVLIHTWVDQDEYGNLNIFEDVARNYPGVPFIMGHTGGPNGAWRAIEISHYCPNVYLDLTLSVSVKGLAERLVKEVGVSRVLFGTDVPFIDPSPQIGNIGLSTLSFEDKKKVFGTNFSKLLGNVNLP